MQPSWNSPENPVPVAEDVQFDRTYSSGVFSASGTGMLLYQTGNTFSERKLDLLDASGKTLSPLSHPLSSSEAQVFFRWKAVAYVLMDVKIRGANFSGWKARGLCAA